jgi:4-hydroxy-4-methyl-2-oxoglutarate aldolase
VIANELRALLDRTTTCAVADVLMKRGIKSFMHSRIRPLHGHRLEGAALTIERRPIGTAPRSGGRPNKLFIEAVEQAPAGAVLVFNAPPPGHEAALWGGLLAAAGVRRGLGGVVADGPVRDPLEICELKQPCFCTGSVPGGQAGILTLGAINEPLPCGDVVVHPGDFVYGDSNGVVIIPAGLEIEILKLAVDAEASDQEAMKRILAGAGLQETMRSLGRA